MKKPLTHERLVLFVYDEISDPGEREQIEKEIRNDSKWYQEYVELVEARNLIDPHPHSPSDKVIKNIMDYAKSLDLHTSGNRKR